MIRGRAGREAETPAGQLGREVVATPLKQLEPRGGRHAEQGIGQHLGL
jgi:hypothetical protein